MAEAGVTVRYPLDPPESLHAPPELLSALREDEPLTRVELADGSPAWLVTRYDEVRTVVTDARFSRAAATEGIELTVLAEMAKDSLLGMDPPEHTRLRKLVSSAFTARRIENLRPRVAEITGELIDGLEAAERPADLVAHFSLPLPMRVICELLGAPPEDGGTLHDWSDTLVGGWGSDVSAAERAKAALDGYFADLAAAKRQNPGDDLMTALLDARDDGDRLSERELVTMSASLLTAGHEATVTYLNLLALTLAADPAHAERLRAEPDLIPSAAAEITRFVQINADGAGMPRFAAEDVELGGVTIAAGSVVIPAYGAANRDPRRFDDPDRLDLGRERNPHLAYGSGLHHCLGSALAKVELEEALRGLVTRLPGLRLAVPESELSFRAHSLIRNFEALPVTW